MTSRKYEALRNDADRLAMLVLQSDLYTERSDVKEATDSILAVTRKNQTMKHEEGSQDERRHFGDIAHHGDHHGRHQTLENEEIKAREEEDSRVDEKEYLAATKDEILNS